MPALLSKPRQSPPTANHQLKLAAPADTLTIAPDATAAAAEVEDVTTAAAAGGEDDVIAKVVTT